MEKNKKQPLGKKKIYNVEIQNTTEVSLHKPRFITITQKDKGGNTWNPGKQSKKIPHTSPRELSKGKLGEMKYRRGKRLENFLEP